MYAKNQQKNPFPGVDIFNKLADYLTPFEINTLGTTLFVCVCVCVRLLWRKKSLCLSLRASFGTERYWKGKWSDEVILRTSVLHACWMQKILGSQRGTGVHSWLKGMGLAAKNLWHIDDGFVNQKHASSNCRNIYIYISKRIQKEQNYT